MNKVLDDYKEVLITEWDKEDIKRQEEMKATKKEMLEKVRSEGRLTIRYDSDEAKEFERMYGMRIWDEFLLMTKDEMHRANTRQAEKLIKNLLVRVEKITGEVKKCGLYLTQGNGWEGLVLAGYCKGDKGVAEVKTIVAGGYNIQRLHVRTLVHAC